MSTKLSRVNRVSGSRYRARPPREAAYNADNVMDGLRQSQPAIGIGGADPFSSSSLSASAGGSIPAFALCAGPHLAANAPLDD